MTHPAVMATKILPPFCFDQDRQKNSGIKNRRGELRNWLAKKKYDGVEGDGKQERDKLRKKSENYP